MFICVTHVDADTKVPCTVEPMRTGPSFPDVKGLQIEFWNQSQWPTDTPLFFGVCDDDADTSTPGIVKVLTAEEYQNERLSDNNSKAIQVREYRAHLLSSCDWTQLADAPVTPERRAEWVVYRQALRDITDQPGFPWEVTWPTQPA